MYFTGLYVSRVLNLFIIKGISTYTCAIHISLMLVTIVYHGD